MAWDMDDFEVKIGRVEQPACLSTVEVLCLTEIHKVLVVCKDLDEEGGSMEIMSPGFQGVNDGEQLLVIDVIVLFSRDE